MFWVGIGLGGREYLGELNTGATVSIVAKKMLPQGDLKNIVPTTAIRMGYRHVVHSCGDCEPMGSRSIAQRLYMMANEAFDFVLMTDFFVDPSPSKHPTSPKWTMATDGNLYPWSSLNTGLATQGYARRSLSHDDRLIELRTISSWGCLRPRSETAGILP